MGTFYRFNLAPVAAPKIKYVYNATNTSVVITWDHPPSHSLHGPLVGYRIIVRQSRGKERNEFYVSKPDVTVKKTNFTSFVFFAARECTIIVNEKTIA